MREEALIIFVKNLIPGKTKTRLAQTMGDEKALRVYRYLLQHTRGVTYPLPVDKFLYYSDFINNEDPWQPEHYHKRVQAGADLGERMKNAFRALIQEGYQRIVIVGSDCLMLEDFHLERAFDQLKEHDMLAGPTFDGGYYLLGMNVKRLKNPEAVLQRIFSGKRWGSASVLTDTLADLYALGIRCPLLSPLNDIDEEKDLQVFGALLSAIRE